MSNMNKPYAAIIDYGMGNLFSVKHACEHAGIESVITSQKAELLNADAAILPGVGAFGDAMNNLKKLDLIEPIKDFISSGRIFMGICLGMQLLMSETTEFGIHKGLDIFNGPVIRFPGADSGMRKIKVPQVGWNQIYKFSRSKANSQEDSLQGGIEDGDFMYFVHSYHAVPSAQELVLSISYYEGIEYCSSIQYKNIFACQFHPERSAHTGLKIYENLAARLKKITEVGNYGNRAE